MFPRRVNESIFFSIPSPALDIIELLNFASVMDENASFYDVPHKVFFLFLIYLLIF